MAGREPGSCGYPNLLLKRELKSHQEFCKDMLGEVMRSTDVWASRAFLVELLMRRAPRPKSRTVVSDELVTDVLLVSNGPLSLAE